MIDCDNCPYYDECGKKMHCPFWDDEEYLKFIGAGIDPVLFHYLKIFLLFIFIFNLLLQLLTIYGIIYL